MADIVVERLTRAHARTFKARIVAFIVPGPAAGVIAEIGLSRLGVGDGRKAAAGGKEAGRDELAE